MQKCDRPFIGAYGVLFFFFQAEDGIRDLTVTGVQTCALPIWYVTAPTDRVKLVSSLPSARSSARYSKRSRVLRATSFASSEPSSHGYSCLSMKLHVGPGTTIVRPSRTAAARLVTFSRISAFASSTAPPSRYGMPQQRC